MLLTAKQAKRTALTVQIEKHLKLKKMLIRINGLAHEGKRELTVDKYYLSQEEVNILGELDYIIHEKDIDGKDHWWIMW